MRTRTKKRVMMKATFFLRRKNKNVFLLDWLCFPECFVFRGNEEDLLHLDSESNSTRETKGKLFSREQVYSKKFKSLISRISAPTAGQPLGPAARGACL